MSDPICSNIPFASTKSVWAIILTGSIVAHTIVSNHCMTPRKWDDGFVRDLLVRPQRTKSYHSKSGDVTTICLVWMTWPRQHNLNLKMPNYPQKESYYVRAVVLREWDYVHRYWITVHVVPPDVLTTRQQNLRQKTLTGIKKQKKCYWPIRG